MDIKLKKLSPFQGIALLFLLLVIPVGIYFVSQKKPVTDIPPKAVEVSCEWCGHGCVDKSTIVACPMMAPPQGYSCVNKNNVCVKEEIKCGWTCGSCQFTAEGANYNCAAPVPTIPAGATCEGNLTTGCRIGPICNIRSEPIITCPTGYTCRNTCNPSPGMTGCARYDFCELSSTPTPTPSSGCIPEPACIHGVVDPKTGTKLYCDPKPGTIFCTPTPTRMPTNTPTPTPYTPPIRINTPTPTTYIAPTPTPIRIIVPKQATTSTPTPTILPMLLSDLLSSPTATLLPVPDIPQPILTIDPFYNSKKQVNPTLSISGTSNPEAELDISIFPDGITTTVTADSLGNWEYALTNKLTNGDKQLTIISRTANSGQTTKMETFTVVGGSRFPFVGVVFSLLIAFGVGGYLLYKKKMSKNQKPPPDPKTDSSVPVESLLTEPPPAIPPQETT